MSRHWQEFTAHLLTRWRQQTRAQTALALKARGNKLYASKQYDEAIAYYTKAIDCEEQAVFYSNRAACPFRLVFPPLDSPR